MFKNLIINGCSYTEGTHTWAQVVNNYYTPKIYKNFAKQGAGNFYISNSTIDYLESAQLTPADTMVIIMWSGTGRKDLRISGEWYYYFKDQGYGFQSHNDNDSEYYIFSGGLTNSWTSNTELKKSFEWAYKLSDPTSLCKDSLVEMIKLENYLKYHGYQYRMASFLNYWSTVESCTLISGDYCIPYFLKDILIYQNYDMNSWIFADDEHMCLGEYAKRLNELDSTGHPTAYAHRQFAEQVIIPQLS